ncbi:PIR Superfamily Protein [Plasmodium ovale curtisi]|uniref:PIR Superfamily Protein n=1 Tax=Plasmodium ovale curtisi TaxID=864141 RepID=A0A1A8X3Q1_PLAOA|nr:PIR Superfamily Protein [Plasmodium ovale curtisi]SBS98802.1 PIR Superfamily Protein [Plasmodium ovale curtisi]
MAIESVDSNSHFEYCEYMNYLLNAELNIIKEKIVVGINEWLKSLKDSDKTFDTDKKLENKIKKINEDDIEKINSFRSIYKYYDNIKTSILKYLPTYEDKQTLKLSRNVQHPDSSRMASNKDNRTRNFTPFGSWLHSSMLKKKTIQYSLDKEQTEELLNNTYSEENINSTTIQHRLPYYISNM